MGVQKRCKHLSLRTLGNQCKDPRATRLIRVKVGDLSANLSTFITHSAHQSFLNVSIVCRKHFRHPAMSKFTISTPSTAFEARRLRVGIERPLSSQLGLSLDWSRQRRLARYNIRTLQLVQTKDGMVG